jgi:hypothetical protein
MSFKTERSKIQTEIKALDTKNEDLLSILELSIP